MLDIKICESITNIVEKLSTSGKKEEVDKGLFKELVRYAGQSEEYLKFCLERVFHHLEQKHSEVRLGAFLIIEQLFGRSQCFRELLLDQFHEFLELTVESNPLKLLPPPNHVAKRLKQRVLQAIHKWYLKFSKNNKRITLSYNFLKHNLKIDFEDALKRNATELLVERAKLERQRKFMAKKVDGVKTEMEENVGDISRVVTEISNCFCLLVPMPEDLFDAEHERTAGRAEDMTDSYLREHGLHSSTPSITIDLGHKMMQLLKTEDNAPLIDNLKELCTLLKNRYLTMVKKWAAVASAGDDQELFRKAMSLKSMMETELKRFDQVTLLEQKNSHGADSDEDSDFEDVEEKLGFEETAISSTVIVNCDESASLARSSKSKKPDWNPWEVREEDAKDPTSILATIRNFKSTSKTNLPLLSNVDASVAESRTPAINSSSIPLTRKVKLLKVAPKLPYDIDLYHWEDKDLKAPSIEIVETDGHRFWTPSGDRSGETIEDPNGVATLRTRVIEYSGTFQPVKWNCRAPLPSGKLCPRKDRLKCPLHGRVIARDEMGQPTKPEDVANLQSEKERNEKDKPPDWQDPEFLKDIQAEIGIDLTIGKRKKQKKKFSELYPNLEDIEKTKNTPRTRLEKKIFNKQTVKRVANTLDELSNKKFKDKFGDQWNYSMSND